MLAKTKSDQTKSGCGQKTFKFLARMTRSMKSPYVRMDADAKEVIKRTKKSEVNKQEERAKDKENNNTLANSTKEVKEKSKKKGWKRVRQAALMTCRYIGLGAAHMSPGTLYASPDYYADPKYWNRSFSSSYKPKVEPQTPHWGSNMMFSGW